MLALELRVGLVITAFYIKPCHTGKIVVKILTCGFKQLQLP